MNKQGQWLFETPSMSYLYDSWIEGPWNEFKPIELTMRPRPYLELEDAAASFGGNSLLRQWAMDLAMSWVKRVRKKSDEQQRVAKCVDWLERDLTATLSGAQKRWGGKTYGMPEIIRAWQISREQQMDFETLERSPYLPKTFRPPSDSVRRVADPVIEGSDKEPVALLTVEFVKELRRRYPQVRVDTYRNHGGGAFVGRGFSIDLWLKNSPKDERGFWQLKDSLALLREVHQAARAVGAEWRVLYNDYSVARVINQETGARRVGFIGNTFPGGGLNWHGPHPLILHFHLDLAPLSGSIPGTSPPLSTITSQQGVSKPSLARSIASLPKILADAVKSGTLTLEVVSRILAGERDVNTLTNLVFYARHPKLPTGYKIKPHEKGFAREWLDIRDKLVKPLLQRLKTSPIDEPKRVSSASPLAKSTASAKLNRFRRLVPLLNQERGDIPLDFLLGWIDVESEGDISIITKLNERGYFQIHPEESKTLGLDHQRLSIDPEYSISSGIKLVRHRAHRAQQLGFTYGTDLFWHIVKLLHWLPKGVILILNHMRQKGFTPKVWTEFKKYVENNIQDLRRLIGAKPRTGWDPYRGIENVEKLFRRGKQLASYLAIP
jgi:hypothetical protein